MRNRRLKFPDAASPEWLRSESQAPQRLRDKVPFQKYPGPRASCLGFEGSDAATPESNTVPQLCVMAAADIQLPRGS